MVVLGEGLFELGLSEDADAAAVRAGIGGDAANVAVMAARLGTDVRLAGRVGDDALGRRLERFWSSAGVDTTHLVRDAGASTGIYVNQSLPGGEHRFDHHRRGSAGSRFRSDDLHAGLLEGACLLVLTGVTLAVSASSAGAARAAVEHARRIGVAVACVVNHRPALGGDVRELARLAAGSDIVVLSTGDAAAVLGTGSHEEIVEALPEVGEVVITDGGRPALAAVGRQRFRQAVPAVAVVDATGAGDALAGAYLGLRCQGAKAEEALRTGVAAASLSVQGAGCALSYPDATAVAKATHGGSVRAERRDEVRA
jgi:2-dehydro-3-deoxygluconokinase